MPVDPIFTRAGTWDGGSFELRLVYEPHAVDTLASAFMTLWAHPTLDGCVADRFPAPALHPGSHRRLPPGNEIVSGTAWPPCQTGCGWAVCL
jgi:hypothetical protein